MKRYLYLILTLVLCSCEVINEADRLIPMPFPANSEHRHVLIEFTEMLQKGASGFQRFCEVMDEQPRIVDDPDAPADPGEAV